jgi:hypothetical protein
VHSAAQASEQLLEVLVPQVGRAPKDDETFFAQDLLDLIDRDEKKVASERPRAHLEHIRPVYS